MTSFLTKYLGHNERVEIDEHYWVDLRPLTKGDLVACQAKLTKMRMKFDRTARESQTEGDVDFAAYQEELVVRSIVDWNLDGPDGILPHGDYEQTRRSYRMLPGKVADLLSEHAGKLNESLEGSDKARFHDGVPGTSEGTTEPASAPSLVGVPAGETALD